MPLLLRRGSIHHIGYKQNKNIPRYIKMKAFLILLCLAVIYSSYSVVILQSTTGTTIFSPTGASTISSAYYNKLKPYFLGSGINWITSSKTTSPTRYQSLFYSNCVGSANLTITAASYFYAYLDGAYIGAGYNYSTKYTFPIKISCGRHNFTAIVYTYSKVNSGLTYAINQNQSKCYKCEITGFWNDKTCSCVCITPACTCKSPKSWRGYPFCGCGCPIYRLLTELAPTNATEKAADNTTKKAEVALNGTANDNAEKEKKKDPSIEPAAPANGTIPPPDPKKAESNIVEASIIKPICIYPRYFSQDTCTCLCHQTYCPPRHTWDAVLCYCRQIIY